MHNSEAADPQKVPQNRPMLWVLSARRTGNDCPLLVLSMPDTWSMSAHLTGRDRAVIPNSTCQSFLLFLFCVYILYILEKQTLSIL